MKPKLRATEFYPRKDGVIKGRVQAVDTDEDPVTVLFEDTITLTSAKSRETFAKEGLQALWRLAQWERG
jgi:hypothetical protein